MSIDAFRHVYTIFIQLMQHYYKNLAGLLFFSTSGCLCTLGIKPSPIALRMAFAIFLWFFGRRPVSLECFIRPVSVIYSDIIVKFYSPSVSYQPECPVKPTLYSSTGLMPSTSKASLCGFLRPSFHFFCSAPDRSEGEYTSPVCHLRYIWRWNWLRLSDSIISRDCVGRSRPASRARRVAREPLPAPARCEEAGLRAALLPPRMERSASSGIISACGSEVMRRL
jgi:hypothetical protein